MTAFIGDLIRLIIGQKQVDDCPLYFTDIAKRIGEHNAKNGVRT